MFRKMSQNTSTANLGNLITGASVDYIAAQSDKNIADVSSIILKNCDGIDSIRLSLLLKKVFYLKHISLFNLYFFFFQVFKLCYKSKYLETSCFKCYKQ
jgi:hypothetical protein